MLEVNGINISGLPFEGLKLVHELLSFEGMPTLLHFRDSDENDIIAYWVDFDNDVNRWLYVKITKQELFNYLKGIDSLKKTIKEISSEYAFLVEFDQSEVFYSGKLIRSHLIPEKYFPLKSSRYNGNFYKDYNEYLKEFSYWQQLRENSTIYKIEPTDSEHENSVGAREAAFVLQNISNSMEGFVSVKAHGVLVKHFGDAKKINRRINKLKAHLSPRIALSKAASFEVWLAMDILTFNASDSFDSEIRENLIQSYREDVVDMDFTREDDARVISEKYKEDERKLIYEPIVRILENEKLKVSVAGRKVISISDVPKKRLLLSDVFRNIVLPPPTKEQLEEEIQKKNKIVAIFVNIKEGDVITKIKKKALIENMLYTQDTAQSLFDIESPIKIDDNSLILKRPIRFIIKADANGDLQLFNTEFDFYAEGNDLHQLTDEVKRQIIAYKLKIDNSLPDQTTLEMEKFKSYLL